MALVSRTCLSIDGGGNAVGICATVMVLLCMTSLIELDRDTVDRQLFFGGLDSVGCLGWWDMNGRKLTRGLGSFRCQWVSQATVAAIDCGLVGRWVWRPEDTLEVPVLPACGYSLHAQVRHMQLFNLFS